MGTIGQYVLKVGAAAMLCAMTQAVSKDWKGHKRILDLVCGLVMLAVVLEPLGLLSSLSWADPTLRFREEGQALVTASESAMRQELSRDISERAGTYIMDKAQAMGASVLAEVEVGEDLVPNGVSLRGSVSPYTRSRLASQIETELGIPKEAQVWNP